jgi:DNA-binding NarL/FixJ family response regulator
VALPGRVVLHGADESLCSLLKDVLGDMGLAVGGFGDGGERPDVVLALMQGGDSLPWVLRLAQEEATPVVVLLPFEDERLRHMVEDLGAHGCYALGTPLEDLKRLLREVVERSPRPGGPWDSSDAPAMGARGRHDE